MPKHEPGDVRNIALIGGPRTGKTSFAEAVLSKCGAIQRIGSVADGTTVSDHLDEEKEKQHSVALSLLHADRNGRRLHLLDCPGYPDFIGEAAAALAAAETALFVVDATKGLTFPGRKAWELAGETGRARVILATHVDAAELDWPAFVASLGEALGTRCVAASVPDGTGPAFAGVKAVPPAGPAPAGLEDLQEVLVEALVEVDDEAMTRFLEEDHRPDAAEARALLVKSIARGLLVPVLCADALGGRGVDEFLTFACDYLPSPLDGPFQADAEGKPVDPSEPGTAVYVFKTVIDPFVGRLSYVRVVRGVVDPGFSLIDGRLGKPEKLAHLQLVQGKDSTVLNHAVAGDILAITKLDHLETGDTLYDPAHPVTFGPLHVPKSMVTRAIELVNHADEAKLSTALKRLAAEDPTFRFERDEATGQLVVHGVSIVHLESVLHRMKERSHVDVKVELPRVPLRETITSKADGHYRHKKQTGGRGQFAEVFLTVKPAPRGSGLVFVDDTVGGSVPRQYIPAIEKGVRSAMQKGIVAGYPVVDVEVAVTDGKFHDVDSDEASFKLAGARAFRDGFTKGRPVMLEPILDLEVAIPSRFLGAITSDLTGRRGHITGMDAMGDTQVVKGRVPQREVLTYPTALRSLTQGEGAYSSGFHDYEVVPANIQQEIMAGFKLVDED